MRWRRVTIPRRCSARRRIAFVYEMAPCDACPRRARWCSARRRIAFVYELAPDARLCSARRRTLRFSARRKISISAALLFQFGSLTF